jgi:hypothetical protein
MLILISYDLALPRMEYTTLFETIKQCGKTWWHYLESVWIINTDLSVSECQVRIKSVLRSSDKLFIVQINPDNMKGWLPSNAWEWFKQQY